LAKLKRSFGLNDSTEHDEYLRDLLRRRLARKDDEVVWPPEVRSALVYWQVGA
jgi:hypothetical protein